MLNQKQILSTRPPVVGQVWYSQSSTNYFRINATDGERVQVQRVAYEFEDKVIRGRKDDTYWWSIETFKLPDMRVVATNLTRFESWLNRVTK